MTQKPCDCSECEIDQDGRCVKCVKKFADLVTQMVEVQQIASERQQELSQEFKEGHRCGACAKACADFVMARFMRDMTSAAKAPIQAMESLYTWTKTMLAGMGVEQSPLLDKAWNDLTAPPKKS